MVCKRLVNTILRQIHFIIVIVLFIGDSVNDLFNIDNQCTGDKIIVHLVSLFD